ncbi:MAG: hypothetical protein IT562_10760 [Alphaproteobacteria bacterium]|nr:hypothetical protein [Alphaproteobacteria bacterium]
MSERGVFAVDRGIWEHDLLLEDAPFSRREAWLWIISEAAWRPHRRRVMGRTFDLERGQLVASLRFIASKWRWSEPRVRRFLAALISEQMVDAKTDAGVTVLTVCKYVHYQRVSLPSDAIPKEDNDAGATQERRKVEDKEDKELPSSLRSEGRARAPNPRATRLPDDWRPDELGLAFANSRGLHGQDQRDEIEKFKNHWGAKAGKDAAKLDWPATWRTWVLNWVKFNGNGHHRAGGGKRGGGDFFSGLAALAADYAGDGAVARTEGEEIPAGRFNIDG